MERSIAVRKIKAKKTRAVNQNVLIATVDGGKDTHYGYYRCPDGTEGESLPFWNNGRGFQEFWERVSSAARTHGPLGDILYCSCQELLNFA